MALYGSMLVPSKSRTTSVGQGYTAQTSYTPGTNVTARLSDSAGSVLQQAANAQTQATNNLVSGLNRMNDGLTDAYIAHNKMVGQNLATEYRSRVNDALHGENGILTREGESSFSCRADAESAMKDIQDELLKGYDGTIAANFFRQNSEPFTDDALVKAQQYQDKQYGKWLDDGDTAFISQSVDLAVSNYKDPNAFSRYIAEASQRLHVMGNRNGVNKDMIEKNVRDATSGAFLNAVKQAIGDKDLASAQRILKQGMTVYREKNPHDLSKPEGLVTKATDDFENRKVLRTKDEEGNEVIKTVQTMTLETDDGKFIVLPTIIDGKEFSPEDAIAYSKKTGKHFGVFDTQEHADDFAQKLHENHAVQYGPGRIYMKPGDITQAKAVVQHEIDRREAEAERARIRAERQHAAAVRTLTSGKEWKDAVYRAEHMNDPTALVAIEQRLRKMGEKGMADSLQEQIKITSYVSSHGGAFKDLPLPEAGKKLEEMRAELEKVTASGDIASHKMLSASITQLEKSIAGKEKVISSEAKALVSSDGFKDALLLAKRDGNTDALGEYTARLDEMGAGVVADDVRKTMLELHELRMDADKVGKGTLAEQRTALDEFGKTVAETTSHSDFDIRSKAYTQMQAQYNARVKAYQDDPGAASKEAVKEDFEYSSPDKPATIADEYQARVADQLRNGVLPDRTKPLSKAELEGLVSDYNTAADKTMFLRSQQERCGEAWPMVFKQMVQSNKFPKNLQMFDLLPTAASAIVANSNGKPGYFNAVADTMENFTSGRRTALKTSVARHLEPALKTLHVRNDYDTATMIEETAQNLAISYVAQGMSDKQAARRAADECMNDRYTIVGSYRIPKGLDADQVEKGVNTALENLLEHPEKIPFGKQTMDELSRHGKERARQEAIYRLRQNIVVTTNGDESGVEFRIGGLVLRDGMSNHALSYSFDELKNIKRVRPLKESDRLREEAKEIRPWR